VFWLLKPSHPHQFKKLSSYSVKVKPTAFSIVIKDLLVKAIEGKMGGELVPAFVSKFNSVCTVLYNCLYAKVKVPTTAKKDKIEYHDFIHLLL